MQSCDRVVKARADGVVGCRQCCRYRCWARSRSDAAVSSSRFRQGRHRSCWSAWRSTPEARCAPTGSSKTCGATIPCARAATRCSRRSPNCAGALGDPAVVVGGDGGYTLVVDPFDVDALACWTRATEAAACSTPATTVVPPTCARRRCRCSTATCSPRPATATGSFPTGRASRRADATHRDRVLGTAAPRRHR